MNVLGVEEVEKKLVGIFAETLSKTTAAWEVVAKASPIAAATRNNTEGCEMTTVGRRA